MEEVVVLSINGRLEHNTTRLKPCWVQCYSFTPRCRGYTNLPCGLMLLELYYRVNINPVGSILGSIPAVDHNFSNYLSSKDKKLIFLHQLFCFTL